MGMVWCSYKVEDRSEKTTQNEAKTEKDYERISDL